MTKILIVEDDISLLNLYNEVLKKEGFEIELADDGQQALLKAEAFIPDVVLLDLMLPYIDGFEVLEKLKSNPITKDARVIVQTNLDSEIQKEKALKLGASEFLVKSDDNPGSLLKEIKKLLAIY